MSTLLRLPPPTADSGRPAVSLILGNLVDNAIRYSAEHHTLRIRPGRAPLVVIEVRDAGISIPVRELSRVTHRFSAAKERLRVGAGLAIVQRRRYADAVRPASRESMTVTLKLPHAGADRETTHPDS